jgi:hypothetical protein
MTSNLYFILQVHQRDVTEELLKNGTASAEEFEWLKHLRQYWEDQASLR